MNVCLGAREPIAQTWFNEHVAAADRATMLSFRSTLAAPCYFALRPPRAGLEPA